MDNIVVDEADYLSINYSPLRVSGKKWRSTQKNESCSEKVRFVKDPTGTMAFISRNGLSVDCYRVNKLYKRALIRRNYGVFKSAQKLWELVNPFKLAGISEKVYSSLYTAIYKLLLKDNFDITVVERYINQDKKIDFWDKSWAGFSDFYDGLFELIDSNTHSQSTIEYAQLIKTMVLSLQDMKWSLNLNLYSKLHIQNDVKPCYHHWMIMYIKCQEKSFKKIDEVPNLIKLPNEIQVSERLLVKKPAKPVDRENFNLRKLEQMMNVQLLKEFKHGLRCTTQSHARLKTFEKKPNTFYSNYLDKISPLSSMIKQTRTRPNVLEKVIDGRKTLNFKSLTQKDLFL
ncbi:hypothetical protein SteCoe_28062 [Stentor coeruleus]|uniref:Uncharacterized protein n=1 Tax=Stentor coeruleus TaxID=5963 RepID=A0A1R2B9L5_9CILI|nr:hypothetical protein SteCoe_28062 [Stentor coeruleus]